MVAKQNGCKPIMAILDLSMQTEMAACRREKSAAADTWDFSMMRSFNDDSTAVYEIYEIDGNHEMFECVNQIDSTALWFPKLCVLLAGYGSKRQARGSLIRAINCWKIHPCCISRQQQNQQAASNLDGCNAGNAANVLSKHEAAGEMSPQLQPCTNTSVRRIRPVNPACHVDAKLTFRSRGR